jgi:hypothetical protein
VNDYQAPSVYEDTAFKRKLATTLLRIRETGLGYGQFYRLQAKSYLIILALFGLGMAWWAAFHFYPAVNVMLGMLVGLFVRDFGIARYQTRAWPIQSGWMDWNKVKAAAGLDPTELS